MHNEVRLSVSTIVVLQILSFMHSYSNNVVIHEYIVETQFYLSRN